MADVPRWVEDSSSGETEVELSEQQLFRLATGKAVTVSLGDRDPRSVDLTVTPPDPLGDFE